ncbi:MAG: hypothetical protein ACOCSK_03185, partial [Rhodothermales bacterium]
FMTRISGHVGMPLSVFLQKFQSSYSASRAEKLFYELNTYRRRVNFQDGFLRPWHEAWFSEMVRAGEISAPGFLGGRVARHAWLNGSWDGAAIPSIDPLKEVNSIEKRIALGHTTGEREAKAYNGSDYMENVKRLEVENAARAAANAPTGGAAASGAGEEQPGSVSDEEREPEDRGDREDVEES